MKLPSPSLAVLLVSVFPSFAQEVAVQPQIDSVGLFKNGLCVVKCSFHADRAGDFAWEEPPRVVHGTFLVESDGAVIVRSTMRKVDDASRAVWPTGNLQMDLAGADVQITLSPDGAQQLGGAVIGRVWTMPEANRMVAVSGRGRSAGTSNATQPRARARLNHMPSGPSTDRMYGSPSATTDQIGVLRSSPSFLRVITYTVSVRSR